MPITAKPRPTTVPSYCSWVANFFRKICWDTNFQALISLAHSTKYPYKPHKLFWALTNISHILTNISHILPNLGSHKYFPYKPHKLSWALTNIFHTSPINYFRPTQILLIPLSKLGHKNILSSQMPKLIYLVGKTPKGPYTFTKACCYMAT